MASFNKLAYIDLETTGARPTSDRITEIAIVLVDNHRVTHEWSSLVNPGTTIPPFIQQLTGISQEMVSDAPPFESLIDTIEALLADRYFVAHNARFDYGFMKNAFVRCQRPFHYNALCTVKLSRKLYPQHRRHNLDSLLERHGVSCSTRHRALDDAIVLPAIVESMINDKGLVEVERAMASQSKQVALPPNLSRDSLDNLPEGPGVYLFYGENNTLLYVGKSISIRDRVRSHFYSVMKNDREMQMAQQVHSIDSIETAGEIGALLLEAELIKKQQPIFNRRLRRNGHIYSILWDAADSGIPEIVELQQLSPAQRGNSHGLFRNRKKAVDTLRKLATDHQLCLKTMGLEKGKGSCFSYQLKKCRGACVGDESSEQHRLRLSTALLPIRFKAWPYKGPIGIKEHNPENSFEEIHLVDQWVYIGSAKNHEDVHSLLEQPHAGSLDIDIYRILQKSLSKSVDIIQLGET